MNHYYGDSYQYLNAFLIPKYVSAEDWLLEYSGYIKMEHAFELVNRIDDGDYAVPDEEIDEKDIRVFFVNTTKVFKEFLEGTGYFETIANRLVEVEPSFIF